jgi:O-antigen/teichoic acid export membrane protein
MKKQIVIFSIANLLGALLAMLGSLWVANLAGPSLMGAYNFLQLLVTYAPLLALGVYNGLNRELPFSIGQGSHDEAGRLAAVALYVCGLISLVAAVGMLLAAFGAWVTGNSLWVWGLGVFAAVVPLSLYRIYLEVTFRTAHDFNWLAVVKIISAVAGLALVPLMYIDSWGGLLGRAFLLTLLGVGFLWIKRPFRVGPMWDASIFRRLLSVGLPIFIVGYVYVIFTNMDRFIILSELNLDALGVYTPALLILQAMTILPVSVAQVIYPRAAERYGREGTIRQLLPVLFMPLPIMLLIQLPFVLLGWFYMDELIMRFMPRFVEGIEVARWSLLVGLVLSMTTPAIVFNVVREQRMYAALMLLSILAVVVAWMLKVGGGGLVGVSVAMLCGSICFAALSAIGAWYLCRKDSCAPIN